MIAIINEILGKSHPPPSPPVGCELPGLRQYCPGGQGWHWEKAEAPGSGRKLPIGQGLGTPLPWGQKWPFGQTFPWVLETGDGSEDPRVQKYPVVDNANRHHSKTSQWLGSFESTTAYFLDKYHFMVQVSGVVFPLYLYYQTWTAWSSWLRQCTVIAEEARGARRAVSRGHPASWQTDGAQWTWRWYRWALHTVETWTQ